MPDYNTPPRYLGPECFGQIVLGSGADIRPYQLTDLDMAYIAKMKATEGTEVVLWSIINRFVRDRRSGSTLNLKSVVERFSHPLNPADAYISLLAPYIRDGQISQESIRQVFSQVVSGGVTIWTIPGPPDSPRIVVRAFGRRDGKEMLRRGHIEQIKRMFSANRDEANAAWNLLPLGARRLAVDTFRGAERNAAPGIINWAAASEIRARRRVIVSAEELRSGRYSVEHIEQMNQATLVGNERQMAISIAGQEGGNFYVYDSSLSSVSIRSPTGGMADSMVHVPISASGPSGPPSSYSSSPGPGMVRAVGQARSFSTTSWTADTGGGWRIESEDEYRRLLYEWAERTRNTLAGV